MKLSKVAILALKGSRDSRKRISEAMGVSSITAYRWIVANDDNLTKAAALSVIKDITGLPESQILEVELEKAG